jgi:hypothetical protein
VAEEDAGASSGGDSADYHCSFLERANGCDEFENQGRARTAWLSSFLTEPSQIPPNDIFNRALAGLDPQELRAGFTPWVPPIARLTVGENREGWLHSVMG